MQVVREQTKYHSFALLFDFSQEKLQFCRNLKEKYGWQKFTFYDKKWRFSLPEIILDIQASYPEVQIPGDVAVVLDGIKSRKAEEVESARRVEDLKSVGDTEFVPQNIKGELYPYQKVGVEFFVCNRGRAILADQPGCISGDAEVIINRGGNGRRYKLRDAYIRFNGLHPSDRYNWKIPSFTRALGENGEFRLRRILNILHRGEQEVLKLVAVGEDNKKYSIVLTPDHEMRCDDGAWRMVSDLKIGDRILANGKSMKFCSTISEHARKEAAEYKYRRFSECFLPRVVKVESIEQAGKKDVYDVVMDDPDHNFIANGLVVHNCGKTVQSLAYAAHTKAERVLVVCPASVKPVWAKEVRKWTDYSVKILDSKSSRGDFESVTPTVFVINYDILKKHLPTLTSMRWDACIVDESQMIKSRSSQRSKVVKLLSSYISSMIFLSATPFLNRPEELFTTLNMIDPVEWDNYYEYTKRYCDGQKTRFGWQAKGATNLFELRERIARYYLRRTKEDVLKDLPKKVLIDYPVELAPDVRKEYDFAEEEFLRYLRIMKNKHPVELARMNYATEKLVKLGVMRSLTTKGKLKAAQDLIDSILDSGEKVLVFSVYNEPLEALLALYGDTAVMITGKTKNEDRGALVDRFQTDPECKVFLGGTKSAGVGITLTAASNVIFLDYSWTPADHVQAQDRVHRIGQAAESVSIYHLYAEDTVDAFMTEILEKKQGIFNAVFDESVDSAERSSFVDEVIDMFVDKKA